MNELDTFHQRLCDDLVSRTDTSGAGDLLASLRADGYWVDVNYANNSAQRWLPMDHLFRTRALAAATLTPGHALHQNAGALDAVNRAVLYWVERKPTSSNWWQQEVNTNQQLGAILVMGKGLLPAATLAAGVEALPPVREERWAGQNRIYTSFHGVYRAVVQNDRNELHRQFGRIRGEAVYKVGLGSVTTARNDNAREGIRRDHSFHQHGVSLYNGFYGAHFVQDMAAWMFLSEGLSFGFTDDEKAVIQDHVLVGQQWMNRHGVLDPNATNRKIAHSNYDYVTPHYHDPVVYSLEYLRQVMLPRAEEIEAFYQHMTAGAPSQIRGNRSFWKSDFMVHAGEGYQISTKLWSIHNLGTEYLNGDNIQGLFLPLGGTFLLLNGTEYLDIFPVWDWGRVPGTTTLRRSPGPSGPNLGAPGPTAFAGGVSNGAEGTMAYDHDCDFVRAKKSWFYFGDAIVMLGAGVNGGNGSLMVSSTLNQSHLRGGVTVSLRGMEASAPSGDSEQSGADWVFHDRVGYLFPQGGLVTLSRKTQSGRWTDINNALSSELLQKEVFTVGFDHGLAPQNGEYAAILVPAVDRAAFDAFRAASPVEILANSPNIQAAWHRTRKLTQISFHAAGVLENPNGLQIEADQPCLVMVDEAESPARVTVADPAKGLHTLTLRLKEAGGTERVIRMEMPGGDDAGRAASAR